MPSTKLGSIALLSCAVLGCSAGADAPELQTRSEAITAAGCSAGSDAFDWSALAQVGVALNAVHGDGNLVFAVGDGGTIVHYDGQQVVQEASDVSARLNGIWTNGETALAVGDAGTILERSSAGWSLVASPTSLDLNAIAGATRQSDGEISALVVGDSGTVLSRRPGVNSWQLQPPLVPVDLYGIFGSGTDWLTAPNQSNGLPQAGIFGSGTDWMAVGAQGALYVTGYKTYATQFPGLGDVSLRGIFGNGTVWIVAGDDGTLQRGDLNNLSTFQPLPTPGPVGLRGIFGNGGTEWITAPEANTTSVAMAVGEGGNILTVTGGNVSTGGVKSPATLTAGWASSTKAFVVSEDGMLYQRFLVAACN